MSKMMKIELSMYGIAEVLHWCHDRNKGRVPGVDTAGFDKMKVLLAEKPQSGDYFTLDQFWKKRVTLDLTEDEVATIDRCLYDIPNFDSEPLPQIRHKFWPQQAAAHLNSRGRPQTAPASTSYRFIQPDQRIYGQKCVKTLCSSMLVRIKARGRSSPERLPNN